MENNIFNIDEIYTGRVVSVHLDTHKLEVYIPKLTPTLDYSYNNTSYSVDLQSEVVKTNTLLCKPIDFKKRVPDVGSLVHVRFLDNDIKKIYWIDFDPFGTNKYIEFKKTGNEKTLDDFANVFDVNSKSLIPKDLDMMMGSRDKPFVEIFGKNAIINDLIVTGNLYSGKYGYPFDDKSELIPIVTSGADGISPKLLKIIGRNAYKFLKDATEPTYASITLTAQLYNTTGYNWGYYNGTNYVSLDNFEQTYENNYDDSIWGTNTYLTFRCTDSSGTANDVFTIYKLYDGSDGSAGTTYYTHFAYANSSDGSVDFSKDYDDVYDYIGIYYGESETDAGLVFGDYDWRRLRGDTGTSVTMKGSVSTTEDLPTGTAIEGDIWVVLDDGNGYVFNGVGWDSIGYIQGPKGDQIYIYYAYANSLDGLVDFHEDYFENALYEGVFSTYIENTPDPALPGSYTWRRFKGDDGKIYYTHFAYSNTIDNSDGSFSKIYDDVYDYIGIYYGESETEDDLIFSDYNWRRLRGDTGGLGNSAVFLTLTNDSHIAPSNEDGTGTIYTSAGGTAKLYEGTELISSGVDYKVNDTANQTKHGLTFSIHQTSGEYSLGGNWDEDDSKVETFAVQATYGTITYIKDYTIAKGLAGADRRVKKIELSSPVITKESKNATTDGTYSTVTIFGKNYKGEDIPNSFGWISIQSNLDSSEPTAENRINVSTGGYDLGTLADSEISDYIIKLYETNSVDDAIVLDTATISVVFKGETGSSVTLKGSVALTSDLTGLSSPTIGDLWVSLEDGDGYVYVGLDPNDSLSKWNNVGKIQGPKGDQIYIYYAYANTIDNSDESFDEDYFENALYEGVFSTYIEYGVGQTTFNQYIWRKFKGDKGDNALVGILSNENITIPTNTDGTYTLSDLTSTATGRFSVFYGLEDITTECTFGIEGGSTKNGLTISIDTNGDYTLTGDLWSTVIETFNLSATYEGVDIIKTFTISKSKGGPIGPAGPTGPGLVFRGEYSISEIYYADGNRRDVVWYITPPNEGKYYVLKLDNTNSQGAWTPSKWEEMTSFSAVATDLLLAQNATITKGLVMGSEGTADNDEIPFIRSANMNSLTTGNGFYISGNGMFTFGKNGGKRIKWDGSDLDVITNLYPVTLGEDDSGNKQITITNNTNHNVTYYYKVWTDLGDDTEPNVWTRDYEMGPASIRDITKVNVWHGSIKYNVKIRFGVFVSEPYPTNPPRYGDAADFAGRFKSNAETFFDFESPTTAGGTAVIDYVFMPILPESNIDRYICFMWGLVFVSSAAGTCTITPKYTFSLLTAVASPNVDNSDENDLAYTTWDNTNIKITKDYVAGGLPSPNRGVSFIAIALFTDTNNEV